MSELTQAIKKPLFQWYFKWTHINKEHGLTPKDDVESKGPPEKMVSFPLNARKQDAHAYVMVDNGKCGPELSLMHTFNDFEDWAVQGFSADQQSDADFARTQPNVNGILSLQKSPMMNVLKR